MQDAPREQLLSRGVTSMAGHLLYGGISQFLVGFLGIADALQASNCIQWAFLFILFLVMLEMVYDTGRQ